MDKEESILTPEYSHLLKNIEEEFNLTPKEIQYIYTKEPIMFNYLKSVTLERDNLIKIVKEQRRNNPNVNEDTFHKIILLHFLRPIINKIAKEYQTKISIEKISKVVGILNSENLVFIRDDRTDSIKRDRETGRIIINRANLPGNSLEEQIVNSMALIISETLHIIELIPPQESIVNNQPNNKGSVSTFILTIIICSVSLLVLIFVYYLLLHF